MAKKCEEVDSKGVDGNALDQFQANRLIEAMIKTDTDDHLTFKEVRDAIAKTGFQPSKNKLSLIEFAVFKFSLEPKQLLLAEQTDNFDGDALIAAANARWDTADAAVKATTATEAAAATAVTKADAQLAKAASGREEIAFLEQALAEQMAGLELAVENAEGAVKSARAKAELEKTQKLGEPRELLDLKSNLPNIEKKGAKAKSTADVAHAVAIRAKDEAAEAFTHATSDSELVVFQVAGCGKGAPWYKDKEVAAAAANR